MPLKILVRDMIGMVEGLTGKGGDFGADDRVSLGRADAERSGKRIAGGAVSEAVA